MPSDPDRPDLLGLRRGGEGAITGTVVCAAVIAYGAGHVDSTGQLSIAILGTVAVYWIAHLHAVTIGSSLTHRHHPVAALRHALVETLPILGASIVPLVVLLLATLLGADLRGAAWAALIATIALLTAYSYVAGVRGGLDLGGRVASAAAGAGVGLLVALLKVLLH
ncbi:hypothetical protein [Nocardioides mangrovi]|uniref:Uncharacterized protein n=1 Tax=Nocardioides mangrovi TaxID=2874580 RepID=A0ABS7UJL6_9ACTN|nr:hypothetical protein [Nocardioides mangrovi]MBZ5741214.1 hypothetical protein [Nocardioides mangrovi]